MKINLGFIGAIIVGACLAILFGFLLIVSVYMVFQQNVVCGLFWIIFLVGGILLIIGLFRGDLD